MKTKFDFSGWATRNDMLCMDGRTIRKDAFKHNDGQTVPLIWDHRRSGPDNVLGHALLENRDEGVYAYCSFNDTESGQTAKTVVKHGDVRSLSIFANQLKQSGANVLHGAIREVSLVLAGANPGAFIDEVMAHGADEVTGMIIGYDENIMLYHSDDKKVDSTPEEVPKKEEAASEEKPKDKETVGDVFNTLSEKQKTVVYAMIGQALDGDKSSEDNNEKSGGGNKTMKHNVFDQEENQEKDVLMHSDQQTILELAKTKSVGSLRMALNLFAEQNESLAHGIDNIESLFPEYQDVRPGAPELIQRDQGWVGMVMKKVHKSPISRIRTRQADVRDAALRASGYQKGKEKRNAGNMKLLKRTTDPQTIFVKDALHRDDIIDITDFDVVAYQYEVMRGLLNEELAMAIMIGDGRDEGDENKIAQEHIRSIWHDDDLYTIHTDVDIASAKKELQGTNTGANFGDNYIYAEAIITAALYAREQYKGTGSMDFYCTPHLLNVMLLARDLNGRRIYESKTDLAAALNVGEINTAEQFEGKTRTTTDNKSKKLLGIFVNLSDYSVGATKGGQITQFNQFDIDFNQEKYLIETRPSGALTRVYSAIALEEAVAESVG